MDFNLFCHCGGSAAHQGAQVSSLLYRRLPVGRLYLPGRTCGLEIRDTADWKSALPCVRRVSNFRRGLPLTLLILAPFWSPPTPGGAAPPGGQPEPVFTTSPLEPDAIETIVALGNLNPRGGHVFPTDHIYLNYGGKPGLEVFAPGDGTVRAVRPQVHGGDKVEVRVDQNLAYYLAHVRLDPGIRVGTRVKAGQTLGRVATESGLDLGASDERVEVSGFLNAARYPSSTLHVIPPLERFAEPLKSTLKAKVAREGPDKNGRCDFDQAGKLVGNWFHESLPASESALARPETWTRQLAFAYDARQPQSVRVSIGGTVAPRGLYAIQAGAPDPATVSQETGLVKYELTAISRRGPTSSGLSRAPPASSGVPVRSTPGRARAQGPVLSRPERKGCGRIHAPGLPLRALTPMPFGNSSGPSSRRDTTTIAQPRKLSGLGQASLVLHPSRRDG